MYKLEINRFFDAAHQLPDTPMLVTKACAKLHGHTYLANVEFEGDRNDASGLVVDFKAIKDIIDIFDHEFINDVFKRQGLDIPSTAENIAFYIYVQVRKLMRESIVHLKVSICEGYKGGDNLSWVTYE